MQCFFGQLIDSVVSVKKKKNTEHGEFEQIFDTIPVSCNQAKKKSRRRNGPRPDASTFGGSFCAYPFFSTVRQYVSFLFFSGDQVSESFREVGLVRHGQIND